MRSLGPIPGNHWPHDMAITVESDSNALLDLLWIREVWNLRPTGVDLPPLPCDGAVSAHARTKPSERVVRWGDGWPSMWQACVEHAGELREGAAILDRLEGTPYGSPERAALLTAFLGPSWRGEYGDDAFTGEYYHWNQTRFDVVSRRQPRSLDEEPERLSLKALVPAWRAGLAKVVTTPCRGTFTRVIDRHAL